MRQHATHNPACAHTPLHSQTVFPLEGPGGLARLRNIDYKSCELGLKVKPHKAGDALLFYSIHPNATFDKVCVTALHGARPQTR